jgi:hypothetical protein
MTSQRRGPRIETRFPWHHMPFKKGPLGRHPSALRLRRRSTAGGCCWRINFRDLSRKREISEQFVWLNRQYGETEAQLSRSAITPSIRADSSQDEGI